MVVVVVVKALHPSRVRMHATGFDSWPALHSPGFGNGAAVGPLTTQETFHASLVHGMAVQVIPDENPRASAFFLRSLSLLYRSPSANFDHCDTSLETNRFSVQLNSRGAPSDREQPL